MMGTLNVWKISPGAIVIIVLGIALKSIPSRASCCLTP
jgi:hypothetical protein